MSALGFKNGLLLMRDGKLCFGCADCGTAGTCEDCVNSGTVSFHVTARLDWSAASQADLDLYMQAGGSAVIYFDHTSEGGVTLNHDAHPVCAATPTPPEIITSGTLPAAGFASNLTFRVWYNQFSNCRTEETPTERSITIANVGTRTICVNGQNVAAGCSWVGEITAYAGYNTDDQSGYAGGTVVTVTVGCCA